LALSMIFYFSCSSLSIFLTSSHFCLKYFYSLSWSPDINAIPSYPILLFPSSSIFHYILLAILLMLSLTKSLLISFLFSLLFLSISLSVLNFLSNYKSKWSITWPDLTDDTFHHELIEIKCLFDQFQLNIIYLYLQFTNMLVDMA